MTIERIIDYCKWEEIHHSIYYDYAKHRESPIFEKEIEDFFNEMGCYFNSTKE